MKLRNALFILACGAVAAVAVAQAQRLLIINGKVASNDVRVINGRAYAPIADIARSMDLVVAVNGNRYELTRKGGTGQLDGMTGKSGDWLFDGGWRFRVNRTYRTDAYNRVNEYYDDPVYQAPEGQEILVVEYSYRNGNRQAAPLAFSASLAGADGSARSPYHNDFPHDGDRWFSQALLPGAEGRGAILFYVPRGFQPKDVLITIGGLSGYDDSVRPAKPTVFRIGLTIED
ncbi:MAG: hypothetical protein MH204_07685 [Fimbriimonadaceae bacterium]|nr:hypothetical protein [Fimbriimonadaceae bacterium]